MTDAERSLLSIQRLKTGRSFILDDVRRSLAQPDYSVREAIETALDHELIVQQVDDHGNQIERWVRK